MGFLAKAATKKRIEPKSGPVNAALTGTPWATTGAIPTGALIRSAVFALDLTGARSSSFRGRQSSLAALFTPTWSSHLWVETDNFKLWNFVLGIGSASGNIAADWEVKRSLSDTTATVGTGRYLTKDDVLQHGSHHDALRDELLRTVGLGQLTEADGEADMTTTSLKLIQPFEDVAPDPVDLKFTIVTMLDEATSRERLALSGFGVLDSSGEEIRWGLGLPKNWPADHVAIGFRPGELAGSAQVSSAGQIDRRVAAQALRSFVDRALFLVRVKDPGASYQGPEEWGPTS
jgi:hypothetical protein